MNGKRGGKAKGGWECADLPKRSCAILGHFLWQRFFHDYFVILLCTHHFVTMDEAFSFEKLFLRSGRKMTNLVGRRKPEKVLGINLLMGSLNSSLSSEGQLHHRSSRTSLPWCPALFWLLLSPPSQDNCTAEGREPHKETSWAWESAAGKLFVCRGKMPTPKSLCNLPL